MLLLRSLPDMPLSDAELQSAIRSKWGRESCIIWSRSRHAEFGPRTHTLSIRAVWGGVQSCHINGRVVAVDDDHFLILNHGRIYSTSVHSPRPVESLAICFCPELVEQIQPFEFQENLQPHENRVSPVLRFIRAHIAHGVVDESWCEEQLIFLLARMQAHHDRLLEKVDSLAFIRPATRREVYRRVGIATDFIHTHYVQSIDLGMLAKAAHLSKFHFLRVFASIHGVTPYAYLQRKRIEVAVRLLTSTEMAVSDVAAHVGFEHESTLVRQMRRWKKLTPRQLRAEFGVA